MADTDMVKEFLSKLDPEDVPFEFIATACILDINGNEVMIKGEQLRMLMSNHPDYSHVKDARIFINLQRVIQAINLEVDYIFERVYMKRKNEKRNHGED